MGKSTLLIFVIFVALFLSMQAKAQFIKMTDRVIVAGFVFEETTGEALPYVNVFIQKTRRGTITDTDGYFILSATINDTITFSSLGYDRKYVVLTDSAADNMKPLVVFLDTRIYEINSIDIIALRRYKQLKYEITNMRLPDDDYVNAARNFPFRPADIDYYSRVNAPGFGLVFSPISALYDMFSKEGKERQKLEELQQADLLNNIIEEKLSPELIINITGMTREETNIFIDWCNFSPSFIARLTDYDLISVIVYRHRQYKKIKNL
ncbi:MAG: carboxypeptidase-like regulatory domain-containing protein [Bacteroidales bacterium]|nr:carboxypeptidase-like regulatory domain-containing protein [Bacteroidales bacterium]